MELKYSPYAAVAELNEKRWPSDTKVSEKTVYNWANNYPRRILDAPPRHDIYFLLHFLKQNWGFILYKLPLMIKKPQRSRERCGSYNKSAYFIEAARRSNTFFRSRGLTI